MNPKNSENFYVIKENQVKGPIDHNSVLKGLETQDLLWLDPASVVQGSLVQNLEVPRVEDLTLKPLLCYPSLGRVLTAPLKASYGLSTATAQVLGQFQDRDWYMMRSNRAIGPFSRLEMIQMLQEKAVEADSFIWKVGEALWKKVQEWDDFSQDQVQQLRKSSNLEVHRVFYKRKHLRAQFDCSLIVNDAKKMFHGDSIEISEGGVGIKLKHSNFNIGHRIFLHFKSGEGVPAFNAVGEIVSRLYPSSAKLQKDEVRYGVKFLNVSNHVKDSIRTYTSIQASA